MSVLRVSYKPSTTVLKASNVNAYSLCSSCSDGIHDGVHVQVAFTSGGGANTHCFIGHLYMDLDTHKHRDVEPGWHLSSRERDTDLTHTSTLLGDTKQWLNTDVHDVTSGHQRCNKTQQILKCSGLSLTPFPFVQC